jgi:hypothetical protein
LAHLVHAAPSKGASPGDSAKMKAFADQVGPRMTDGRFQRSPVAVDAAE